MEMASDQYAPCPNKHQRWCESVGVDIYLNFSVQQSPNNTETIHTHTLGKSDAFVVLAGMGLDFGLDLTAKQVGDICESV